MKKNIIGYLLVALIAYGLGQVSTLNAASSKDVSQDTIKKMDLLVKNQEKMIKMLKKIHAKV